MCINHVESTIFSGLANLQAHWHGLRQGLWPGRRRRGGPGPGQAAEGLHQGTPQGVLGTTFFGVFGTPKTWKNMGKMMKNCVSKSGRMGFDGGFM